MTGKEQDYALVQGPQPGWRMTAHRADCPTVRKLADAGKPVMTMIGCEGPLPEDVMLAPCLTDPRSSAAVSAGPDPGSNTPTGPETVEPL